MGRASQRRINGTESAQGSLQLEKGFSVLYQDGRALARFWAGFLALKESTDLFRKLKASKNWEQETPTIRGVEVPTRRSSIAYGERGLVYEYAGIRKEAQGWPKEMEALGARIAAAMGPGVCFNFCLVNHYPNGDVGLGWHSDREGGLVVGAPVVSISLGDTRTFKVRETETQAEVLSKELGDGDLFTMEGEGFQSKFEHSVPPRKHTRERISLTFRVLK